MASSTRPRGFVPGWKPRPHTRQLLEQVRQVLREYADHLPLTVHGGTDGVGQRTWALGRGRFVADYQAEVEIKRTVLHSAGLPATALRDLPGEAVPYLLPSRYCEAADFEGFVHDTFMDLRGGDFFASLVDAIDAYDVGARYE